MGDFRERLSHCSLVKFQTSYVSAWGGDVDAFLADMGYARGDVGSWVLHTGGPKVLEATQAALGFEKEQVAASWDCLRKTGNLSSASVLVVLEESNEAPSSGAGHPGIAGCDGPGILLRTGLAAMVDSAHHRETDVFVIGGGPAGLAAAIAARQRGFDVMVADGALPPIDKPCGEGLMPDGLCALADLGVTIPPEESYPFRESAFSVQGLRSTPVFRRGTASAYAGRNCIAL